MSVTAQSIIDLALADIGAKAIGEATPPAESADGLVRLNQLVDSLATQPLTMPFIARLTFALTAGKGTEINPYTIGPGGNFDTARPTRLEGAGLILGGLPENENTVEIPRGVFTDDGYEATQIKALQNAFPTCVYYRPTYSGGLGTLILWPVPNTSDNALALYIRQPIAQFATLTTAYSFPYGYAEMFEYQLALRLANAYGRSLTDLPYVMQQAAHALGVVKRNNYRLTDLPTDLALTHSPRGGYNINTGTGGSTY